MLLDVVTAHVWKPKFLGSAQYNETVRTWSGGVGVQPLLARRRKEDQVSEASLGYVVEPCLNHQEA